METFLYHIGRDKISNQIYVEDDSVSISHAQVYIDENKNLIIIDLLSTNGVIINGKKIEAPTPLKNKDLISLGSILYKKQDFFDAIELFEINKNKGNDNGVLLVSSHLKSNVKKQHKKKIKTDVLVAVVLIAIAMLIIAFGVSNYLSSQNVIKNKIIELQDPVEDNQTKEEIVLPPPVSNKIKKPKTTNKKINSEVVEKKTKPTNKNINSEIVEKKSKLNKQRTDIIYDFSCLTNKNDNGSNEMITEFGDLTRNVQNTILKDVEISILDEKKAGNRYVKDLKKQKKFIDKGSDYSKLNRIMKNLTSRLAKPRGIDYEMFFVDDTIKNVFTLGGNIVFYKGMYDFCKNDSEIASIIAHEIAHNELGHSTLKLKKQKASDRFGIFGEIALIIESNTSMSFNQKQEAQADLFGLDLMYPTDYNSCAGVGLWERMSETENNFNIAENLFKSHPYSINRINCLKNHSKNNYNKNCN